MYIHYSTGNISGPRTLVRIVEISVIGGVHFRRFYCNWSLCFNHRLCTDSIVGTLSTVCVPRYYKYSESLVTSS